MAAAYLPGSISTLFNTEGRATPTIFRMIQALQGPTVFS